MASEKTVIEELLEARRLAYIIFHAMQGDRVQMRDLRIHLDNTRKGLDLTPEQSEVWEYFTYHEGEKPNGK